MLRSFVQQNVRDILRRSEATLEVGGWFVRAFSTSRRRAHLTAARLPSIAAAGR
jgi:hypothetical protein